MKVLVKVTEDSKVESVYPSADCLDWKYIVAKFRGRNSGRLYHEIVTGQKATIKTALSFIKSGNHDVTPKDRRLADFIREQGGAFIEYTV